MWIHLMKNKKILNFPGARSVRVSTHRTRTLDQSLERRIATARRGILTQIKLTLSKHPDAWIKKSDAEKKRGTPQRAPTPTEKS
jgi:hypothetical protein